MPAFPVAPAPCRHPPFPVAPAPCRQLFPGCGRCARQCPHDAISMVRHR
ncbi:MAG: 4Fe-4S binding protein [Actinobacteria bacterium]|nr:4Fe-4S binding protein [Actinomycetota bacterium]MBU4219737.1 4Fe-4S binding protein [Actinomycetota bacterium]MBU4357855.1 4Fe-4S binding protein [Actinomycetota bacterium]MBU4392682.1 4Fe-4S binding protein [Actinomycetota bacterium]MBU4402104.1 4Fe-4S binding protein [Actinomycetota bacterium]